MWLGYTITLHLFLKSKTFIAKAVTSFLYYQNMVAKVDWPLRLKMEKILRTEVERGDIDCCIGYRSPHTCTGLYTYYHSQFFSFFLWCLGYIGYTQTLYIYIIILNLLPFFSLSLVVSAPCFVSIVTSNDPLEALLCKSTRYINVPLQGSLTMLLR